MMGSGVRVPSAAPLQSGALPRHLRLQANRGCHLFGTADAASDLTSASTAVRVSPSIARNAPYRFSISTPASPGSPVITSKSFARLLQKVGDRHAERLRNEDEPSRSDAVGAFLVLLDLTTGDAQLVREFTLRHVEHLAAIANPAADGSVERRSVQEQAHRAVVRPLIVLRGLAREIAGLCWLAAGGFRRLKLIGHERVLLFLNDENSHTGTKSGFQGFGCSALNTPPAHRASSAAREKPLRRLTTATARPTSTLPCPTCMRSPHKILSFDHDSL